MNSGESRSSATSPSTSSSLLARVRQRDADAWSRLSELYGPIVYGWARHSGLQASDAADIVQDVFGAVAAGIDEFRRERPGDTFRGWLWTVARNKIRDHFRSIASQPRAQGGTDAHERLQAIPEHAPQAEDDLADFGSDSLGRRALAMIREDFDARSWDAFWRVAVEGDRVADVAEDLGVTVWAVYKTRMRILRRLRAELDGLIE